MLDCAILDASQQQVYFILSGWGKHVDPLTYGLWEGLCALCVCALRFPERSFQLTQVSSVTEIGVGTAG